MGGRKQDRCNLLESKCKRVSKLFSLWVPPSHSGTSSLVPSEAVKYAHRFQNNGICGFQGRPYPGPGGSMLCLGILKP
ncbi:hypothetical protein VNO80_21470 [Phaseolus coccineus]|uniref:Uncharacterized protein n=1 Tax=Phaseolus coccineus TaxID=3886 RepID=A0AAN9M3Y1_PHACN